MLDMLGCHFSILPLALPNLSFVAHDPGTEGIEVFELTKK